VSLRLKLFGFSTILFLCCFNPVYALSLSEAVDIAVSQNKSLINAKNEVKIAEEHVVQARSKLFPKIDLSYTSVKLNEAPYMELPASFGGGEMPTGLEKSQSTKLSLVQPIYAGGKIVNGMDMADVSLSIAREKYNKLKADVVFDVKKIFLTILLAKKEVAIAEEGIKIANEHLQVAKNKYDAGAVTNFDMLKAESQIEILKPQLISSKSKLDTALLQLNKCLELPIANKTEVTGELTFNEYNEKIEEAIQRAFAQNYDLKIIQLQLHLAETALKNSFSGYLPNVSLLGNKSHFNEYSPNAEHNERWKDNWSIVGVASLNLFDGLDRESKVAESRSMIEQLQRVESQIKDDIELQVRQSFMRLQETVALKESAMINLDLAERSLKMANDQYRAGQLTSLDVLNTQLVVNQAKTSLANTYFNHEMIIATIQKMTGK
jgi:outer membrane protein TolC